MSRGGVPLFSPLGDSWGIQLILWQAFSHEDFWVLSNQFKTCTDCIHTRFFFPDWVHMQWRKSAYILPTRTGKATSRIIIFHGAFWWWRCVVVSRCALNTILWIRLAIAIVYRRPVMGLSKSLLRQPRARRCDCEAQSNINRSTCAATSPRRVLLLTARKLPKMIQDVAEIGATYCVATSVDHKYDRC